MSDYRNRIKDYRTVDAAQIRRNPANFRRHPDAQRAALRSILGDVGQVAPLLVLEDGDGYLLLDGEARWSEGGAWPVAVLDLTPDEAATVLAMLDKIGADAEIDPAALMALLDALPEDARETAGHAWSDDELAMIVGEAIGEHEPEPDEPVIVDETKPTRCQLGDVWRIGRHTVACLDSTDRANVERLIAGRKVGMVVADPPYGIDLATDFTEITGRTNDYTTLSGRARTLCAYAPIAGDDTPFNRQSVAIVAKEEFWFGADYYVDTLDDYGKGGAWLVWDKRQEGALDEMRGNNFELCWSKVKHKRELIRITWIGVLGHNRADDGNHKAHPSQKPVKVFHWIYNNYGSASDIIFDPFLGSGPSLKAAEPSGRTVIGCELSPHYIDHIIEWGEAHNLTCERVSDAHD